jgi:hypothetical protein
LCSCPLFLFQLILLLLISTPLSEANLFLSPSAKYFASSTLSVLRIAFSPAIIGFLQSIKVVFFVKMTEEQEDQLIKEIETDGSGAKSKGD